MSTPSRRAHANARHERRTVVQNSARICIPAEVVCAVAGRVQRRARIERSQCVRACARSARTRDRHASRISIGRCACASLRECTMKRPRNRVERSTPLTTAITREWKNREYDRTRSALERFLSNFRENSFFSLLEKCSRSYLNGARDYLLIRTSSTSVR